MAENASNVFPDHLHAIIRESENRSCRGLSAFLNFFLTINGLLATAQKMWSNNPLLAY
jgi:hypothetical protein